MSTHDSHNPQDPKAHKSTDWANSTEPNSSLELHQDSDSGSKKAGYELADANVKDTAMFLVVMGATLAVVFVLAFGIGKLIFMEIARQDGPTNKWSQLAGAKPANMVSDPGIQQQQLQQIVKRFPTPRLETDDGNMEVTEMHAREDMLLNHYSWVNQQNQTVRIPIERAMQLLAQRGLPVEAAQQADEQPMSGDGSTIVTAPLTDGFARTGPELQMMYARQQALEAETPHGTHAELHDSQ